MKSTTSTTMLTSLTHLRRCRHLSNGTFQLKLTSVQYQTQLPTFNITPTESKRLYSSTALSLADENKKGTVSITYIEADGTEKTVQAEIGKNLMEIAHEHNVELEGACGGELACSTCHLIFEERIYKTLPEKVDDENDMLDLAIAVTETSRLGCQIKCRADFDGMKVQIPDDGF